MGLALPYVLIGGGLLLMLSPALLQLGGVLWGWIFYRLDSGSNQESSDIPAPPGFVEHLERIKAESESASPEQREEYYFLALTQAQTLRRENRRLNGTPPLPRKGDSE